MADELAVTLVGFGLAGRAFHAPLIAATAGLTLSVVVTSRRAEVERSHPGARVAASVEEAWEGCDLLVVAAPNRVHVPLAGEAIRRGVPVVVDKPLAIEAQDAERLVAEARERDVPLTVFHNRRWDGDFLTVRRLVSEGVLGELIRLESRFERFRPQVAPDKWRELGDPAQGGGSLLDLGSHLVDQALVLLGPVVRVYAEVNRLRAGVQADDDAFLALEHEGGVHSHLSLGAVSPLHGPRFALSGLKAGFATTGLDVQEDQLRGGMTPADPRYGRAERSGRLVDDGGERPVELERGDYPAFYARVVTWLRGQAPPPVEPDDAVAGLRVLEAARTSAAEGRVVELPFDTPPPHLQAPPNA